MKLHADASGNMYVGAMEYLGINYYGTTSTVERFFLSKYDVSGNLQWTVAPISNPVGANYVHSSCDKILSDKLGNVYVLGSYTASQLSFSTYGLSNSTMSPRSFLAKIDSAGTILWIVNINYSNTNNSNNINATDMEFVDDNTICFSSIYNTDTQFMNFVSGNVDNVVFINTDGEYEKDFTTTNWTPNLGYAGNTTNHCNVNLLSTYPLLPKMRIWKDKIIHFWIASNNFNSVVLIPGIGYLPVAKLSGFITITDTTGVITNGFKVFDLNTEYYIDFEFEMGLDVDTAGNIYIGYSPITVPNHAAYYYYLTNQKTVTYTIPGLGDFKHKKFHGLVQKFDQSGNILFNNFVSGDVRGITVNAKSSSLYGIANYFKHFTIESADNNHSGLIPENDSLNSALFAYDLNGNLKWIENLTSTGQDIADDIFCSKDTCNDDVYFTVSAVDTLSFKGFAATQSKKYYVFKISEDMNCNTATCIQTLGMLHPDNLSDANCFPNPFNDELNVTYSFVSANKENVITLLEVETGKIIITKYCTERDGLVKFDLADLAAGFYMLRIREKNSNDRYIKVVKAE